MYHVLVLVHSMSNHPMDITPPSQIFLELAFGVVGAKNDNNPIFREIGRVVSELSPPKFGNFDQNGNCCQYSNLSNQLVNLDEIDISRKVIPQGFHLSKVNSGDLEFGYVGQITLKLTHLEN